MLSSLLHLFLVFATHNFISASPAHDTLQAANNPLEDYPYVVSIEGSQNEFLCVGSIISNTSVLVPGYCAYLILRNPYSNSTVHTGCGFTGPRHKIGRIHTYQNETFQNNIAVLCLKNSISVSKTCRPIPLTDRNEKTVGRPGRNGTVVGWGDSTSGHLGKLRAINMTTVDSFECRLVYPNFVYEQDICMTNPKTGGEALCEGDYGAPLVMNESLAGILMQHSRICTGRDPDMYYSIAHFRDWIRSASEQCL